jgi:transaldolase
MKSPLHRLTALGLSVWIDCLSRDLSESGALVRAIDEDAVVGVTSNATIFERELSQRRPRRAARNPCPATTRKQVFLELAMRDIGNGLRRTSTDLDKTEGGTATSRSR